MVALFLIACGPDYLIVEDLADPVEGRDPIVDDTAVDSEDADTADTGDTGVAKDKPWVCLDWEEGGLEVLGHEGNIAYLPQGAILLNAKEGRNYSALIGEESLDYVGDRALVLRSNHAGDTFSYSWADLEIEVNHKVLLWRQLSEVDAKGIELWLEIGAERVEVPVETGGFVPALESFHEPIEGFPEIQYGEATTGTLVEQEIDLSAWSGQRIDVRIVQHTRSQGNGFFTVLDEICW